MYPCFCWKSWEMYLDKGNEYLLFYYGNSQQASALLDLRDEMVNEGSDWFV